MASGLVSITFSLAIGYSRLHRWCSRRFPNARAKSNWVPALTFSHSGKYYQYDGIALLPRPVQTPAPPILIAAASEGSAEEAGRRGYPFACAQFSVAPTPEQVAAQISRFNHSYMAAGHGQPPDD